jgi:hypothetical protein
LEYNGHLTETGNDGSLWGDTAGDLFREHWQSLEQFSLDAGYAEFYRHNRAFYEEVEQATRSILDMDAMMAWLEGNFSERPGSPIVYVSVLMAGHHWTSAEYQRVFRIWVDAIYPSEAEHLSPLQEYLYAGSVFTELDHRYVNPATEELEPAINKALGNRSLWATDRAWASYPTPLLVFNEYVTHAAFVLYSEAHLDARTFEQLRKDRIRRMEEVRGFTEFGAFLAELSEGHPGNRKALEDELSRMISWCATHVAG